MVYFTRWMWVWFLSNYVRLHLILLEHYEGWSYSWRPICYAPNNVLSSPTLPWYILLLSNDLTTYEVVSFQSSDANFIQLIGMRTFLTLTVMQLYLQCEMADDLAVKVSTRHLMLLVTLVKFSYCTRSHDITFKSVFMCP